jgi:hypothetical protein
MSVTESHQSEKFSLRRDLTLQSEIITIILRFHHSDLSYHQISKITIPSPPQANPLLQQLGFDYLKLHLSTLISIFVGDTAILSKSSPISSSRQELQNRHQELEVFSKSMFTIYPLSNQLIILYPNPYQNQQGFVVCIKGRKIKAWLLNLNASLGFHSHLGNIHLTNHSS